jgi:cation diffusion facilitator family transporter
VQNDKKFVTLVSVLAAVLLTGGKLVVGLLTGSLGILSEAAHSGMDFIASLVTYFAVRVSDKPADFDHTYGHGKIENLSALLEALLVLAACAWIVSEAARRLFFEMVPIEVNTLAFGVVICSIVIDLWRSRALRRVAKKYNSQALEADALNFTVDLWSSSVVLGGLCLVKIGEHTRWTEHFEKADAVAAMVATVFLMSVTIRLGKRAVDVLMDRAPRGTRERVEKVARAVEGVSGVHEIRVRSSGARLFIDLHICVARNLGLEPSHRIADAVEAAVRGAVSNSNVIVHVDPRPADEEKLADRVRVVAANQSVPVHHLHFHSVNGELHLTVDLEVEAGLSLDTAHEVSKRLEQSLRAEIPELRQIHTHIEPRRSDVQPADGLGRNSRKIERQVQEVVKGMKGVLDCHEVEIGRSDDGRLMVSLHCTFPDDAKIEEVHRTASRIERALRGRFTNFREVFVHTEPRSTRRS